MGIIIKHRNKLSVDIEILLEPYAEFYNLGSNETLIVEVCEVDSKELSPVEYDLDEKQITLFLEFDMKYKIYIERDLIFES